MLLNIMKFKHAAVTKQHKYKAVPCTQYRATLPCHYFYYYCQPQMTAIYLHNKSHDK